jgi:DNA-binding Xre family transcriptional regulator
VYTQRRYVIICEFDRTGANVIRYLLQNLVAKKSFEEGRRIDWMEIAGRTDIHRVTLSKMVNQRGYNCTTTNLDKLCRYFDCAISELIEYVPDEQLGGAIKRSAMGPKANTAAAQAGANARHTKAKPEAPLDSVKAHEKAQRPLD